MKAILVHLAGGDLDETALVAALTIARRFGSHIEALHTRLDPAELNPFIGGPALAAGVPELAAAIERDAARFSKSARDSFERWRAAYAVAVADDPKALAGPSARWRETVGLPQRSIARCGRLADLVVLGRETDAPSGQTRLELEAALFDTGRPVLLVPRAAALTELRSVMVAWNGSLEGARTVALALPILAAADQVTVATAPEADVAATEAEALVEYLGIHGIRAKSLTVGGQGPLGRRLLSAAGEVHADLLAMGAYTHGRARQMIFGGATRHVLEAAEIPVLMSR